YFSTHKLMLLIVAVLVVVTTYLQVLTPNLLGQAVDCYIAPATQRAVSAGAGVTGLPGAPQPAVSSNCWYATLPANATSGDYITGLGGLVLFVVAISVAASVLTGVMFFLMTFTGQNVLRTLRIEIFRHIHRLSIG